MDRIHSSVTLQMPTLHMYSCGTTAQYTKNYPSPHNPIAPKSTFPPPDHWKEILPSFTAGPGYSKPILPPPKQIMASPVPSTQQRTPMQTDTTPVTPIKTHSTPTTPPTPPIIHTTTPFIHSPSLIQRATPILPEDDSEDKSDEEDSDLSSGSSSSNEDSGSGKKRPTWLERFHQLKEFKANYGHCKVPYRWAENPGLGRWVGLMRKKMKDGRLEDDKRQMLQSIAFSWSLIGCRTRLLKRERSASLDFGLSSNQYHLNNTLASSSSCSAINTNAMISSSSSNSIQKPNESEEEIDPRRSMSIPFKKRKLNFNVEKKKKNNDNDSSTQQRSKSVSFCTSSSEYSNLSPDTQQWMSRYLSV